MNEIYLKLKNELISGFFILSVMFITWAIMIYFGWLPSDWLTARAIIGSIFSYFLVRFIVVIVLE